MQSIASLADRLDMSAEEAVEKLRFMLFEVRGVDSTISDEEIDILIDVDDDSSLADKRALGNVYMKRVLQPEDVTQVIGILDQAGARQFAESRAREIADEALSGTGLAAEVSGPLRDLTDWALEGNGHD